MSRPASNLLKPLLIATGIYAVVWWSCLLHWFMSFDPITWLLVTVFTAALPLGFVWIVWATRPVRQPLPVIALVASGVYVGWWFWSVYITDLLVWDTLRSFLATSGTVGLFFVGLAWVVWAVEKASHFYETERRQRHLAAASVADWSTASDELPHEDEEDDELVWNPLDPHFWCYGRRGRKLNQSITALLSYSLLFLAGFLAMSQLQGCQEIYESPFGGGEQKQIAQIVKVQKVIRKRFVVNPFSAIAFKVPPIEEIVIPIEEMTAHTYTVGYGEGAGAGFASGTKRGKVRFIRLEYAGGDWNQDFGVGADLNMLIEYNIRTRHRVAEKTESRTVAQLKNFPIGKSPPIVYMTGQKSISLSKSEVKILREYLIEKHGMLFGDNGGSSHFHNQFVAMMRQTLPNVRPVRVPLDDIIHRVPYTIPFLPYVAPHGGKDALGWKVDGRWVCYYHPGDIGDAWIDDHSGVPRRIWEYCYRLGTNVMFYAHAEHAKWLDARKQNKE